MLVWERDAGVVDAGSGSMVVAGVDFFVSHAGPDRGWAEWVAWHLREAGYTVELDAWDWAAGDNFVTRMHAAVDAADRVVALLSAAYFADGRYTGDEWSAALVRDDGGGHRLVPVQIPDNLAAVRHALGEIQTSNGLA
jgi:hypothetical protein